jgi:hypothetical protein
LFREKVKLAGRGWRRFNIMKNLMLIEYLSVKHYLIFFSVLIFLSVTTVAQNTSEKPKILEIDPKVIFDEMFIGIIGIGLYSRDGQTQVIFSQGEKVIVTTSDGGGFGKDGRWLANVQVPVGLSKGICKIEVIVDNKRSLPYFVNVSSVAKAPKLTYVSAGIVNPGYFVWIEGQGFIENQILELIDAKGQKFSKLITGVSTDNSLSLDIPLTTYSGIARLRVIEKRNGIILSSNEIKLEIRRGAIPVLPHESYFLPLSRGQWFRLAFNDSRPLRKAEKIELRLEQGSKSITTFITDFRNIHFQIPKSFKLGTMKIMTRVFLKDGNSEWSKPVKFTITKKSAKPTFNSIETLPVKAEAKFTQDTKIEVLPIYLGMLPRVKFPLNVQKGKLQIHTRYWFRNSFTEWKSVAEFTDFDIERNSYNDHPEFEKEKSYTFSPFFQRLWFEDRSSKFYKTYRGTNLIIYGDYFEEKTEGLSFLIENGSEKVYLKCLDFEFSFGAVINIPNEIPIGEWNVWYINQRNNSKFRLPIKLIIE